MKLNAVVTGFINRPGLAEQTRVKYDYKLRPFVRLWGGCPIDQITAKQLAEWFDQAGRLYAPATLSIYRAVLLALFNFAMEDNLIERNPAAKLPTYCDRPRLIICANEKAVAAVLACCERVSQEDDAYLRRDAAIFALAASSGGRRSNLRSAPFRETVHILKNPIEDEAGKIYALPVGGKTELDLVFGEWVATILGRYLAIRPPTRHNWLFVHLHPERGTMGDPLGDRGMELARLRICKAAGVDPITYTNLRKMRGTQLARQYGLEIAAVALGHASGTRVIREFYYDPDRHAARVATIKSALIP